MYLFSAGEQAGKLLAERIYFDNETVMNQINGGLDASLIPDFRTGQIVCSRKPTFVRAQIYRPVMGSSLDSATCG